MHWWPPSRSWCRCSASSSRWKASACCCRPGRSRAPHFNPDLEVKASCSPCSIRRNNLAQQVATGRAQLLGKRVYDTVFRATCACPRRRPMACPCCCTIFVARGPGLRATTPAKCCGASRPRERRHERTLGAEPRVGARKRGLGMGLSALLGNAGDRRTPKASAWSRSNSCAGRRLCSRGVISAKTNWRRYRIDPRQGRHAAATGPPAARW